MNMTRKLKYLLVLVGATSFAVNATDSYNTLDTSSGTAVTCTGCATSANQSTEITALQGINTNTPADGTTVGPLSVTSATNLFSIDTSGFNGIAIQITSAGTTCTVTYEGSNDNTTWVSIAGQSINPNPGFAGINTTTTTGSWIWPTSARYIRARVSTYTSGTVTAYYSLRRTYNSVATILDGGAVAVNGNVASGSADSGNPVKVGGVYNTSLPTLTNGQRGDMQLDSVSRLIVNVASIPAQTSDGTGSPATGPGLFNGTNYDRHRSGGFIGYDGVSTLKGPTTYSFYTQAYTGYITPNDLFCIGGSGTKTVTIDNAQLFINTTAGALQNIFWIKRSTADTGGTPTALTAIPFNSTNAAATSTVTTYGSAPSAGTAVGTMFVTGTTSGASTGPGASSAFASSFITNASLSNIQSVTLNGTNEQLCASYNGAALTAGFTTGILVNVTEN